MHYDPSIKQSVIILILLVRTVQLLKPNVLFIIIDDLNTNIGSYGYKNGHTPNIDKLASNSFVFRNAFAQQALCGPSRNSLLTSRRPDSLHLYDVNSYWRSTVGNFTTLPEHFKNSGFFTHSIGKVFHPGITSNNSDDMPYSWSEKPFHANTQKYKDAKVCVKANGQMARNLLCPVIVNLQPGDTLPDIESTNEALNFIRFGKNVTSNKPFLLAVGFHKPHIPLKFPVEYLKYHPVDEVILPTNRWRPALLPTVAWNPWSDIRRRDDVKLLNLTFPFGVMPDNYMKQLIRHYNSAVSYIDDLIGLIMKELDKNTIVVLTSDHGWSLGEHGEFAKYSNFDIATRVPLLIHVPRLNNGQVIVKGLVELVDLFPTLVDLTQVSKSIPTCDSKGRNKKLCTEGKSLVPLMTFKTKRARLRKSAIFSQYPRPSIFPQENSDQPKLRDIKIMGYSMRTERYRYTEWVQFNTSSFKPNWRVKYDSELYDFSIDPNENMNLSSKLELFYIIKMLSKQLRQGWRYIY